jgi:hypothetical protein
MAGEVALKGAVGEAVKDIYKALKSKVAVWAGGDLEALEKAPASTARQAVVAEAIDAQPENDKAAARELAQRLITALKESGPVALDIGRLDALAVRLGAITVTEGKGVRIAEAHVHGSFETGPINVGKPSAKK